MTSPKKPLEWTVNPYCYTPTHWTGIAAFYMKTRIVAEIHVAGFEVADTFTDSFAVGELGHIDFSAPHESGVLVGMDYKFNYGACELFRYINTPIDYNLDYWVFDDNNALVSSGTNQLIDSRGMGADCSSSELIFISGLYVGGLLMD